MKKINIKKIEYNLRHRYLQLSTIVIVIALVIAASWTWSAIGVMQRNYALQKEIDSKNRQKQLLELQNATLQYQQNYYKSREYQELQARDVLGLAEPGEHVLILPPNSKKAKRLDDKMEKMAEPPKTQAPSNVEQWMNFIFGGNQKSLQ